MENRIVEKPNDWPLNGRETSLSMVMNSFEKFIKKPNYINKENLLNLLNQDDLNESDDRGVCRTTDYELGLINTIYEWSVETVCIDGILYIYRLLIRACVTNKFKFMMLSKRSDFNEFIISEPYMKYLHNELKFFYYIYAVFNWDKNKTFTQCLIDYMQDSYDNVKDEEANKLLYYFNILVYYLSFNYSIYLLRISKNSREEISQIFSLQAKYLKRLKDSPLERPLRGIVCISIANWLLKSRNNYNRDNIYKCISTKNMIAASNNFQLWMKKTKKLNDEDEGCISHKFLLNIEEWKKYHWMSDKDYNYSTNFVSSFCKMKPNDYMLKEYGDSWIGFKNDKIASSISPIYLYDNIPKFSLVMSYDVCYNEEEYKKEINLIGDIVDKYDLNNDEKNELFNQIIRYWRYSVKENKWSIERERRYEILLWDEYNYKDLEIDDTFLKVKTYLTICPDFCYMGDWSIKNKIRYNLEEKYKINQKPYFYCEDCFYRSFDYFTKSDDQKICPICGSSKFYKRNNIKI